MLARQGGLLAVFSCGEHPVFGVHLLGSLFGIMQLALPECVAGYFCFFIAASCFFLLSHFSSFPIHRSYALVCSCVDVDVKLTDTHWACPLGSIKSGSFCAVSCDWRLGLNREVVAAERGLQCCDMRLHAARSQWHCLVCRVSSICAVSRDWQQ